MKTVIDQIHWKRKEHYDLFSAYDEPFFGLVAEVDCSVAYRTAKEREASFYFVYLHKLLLAVNQIEEFRYRIDGDNVVVFEEIHASATVARPDETFAFSFVKYHPSFDEFSAHIQTEMEAVQQSSGLRMNANNQRLDVIQFSAIPWIKFTSLSHARNLSKKDSIPKLSVGRLYDIEGKKMMPVSVHAHHGLVDGLHVGQFFSLFQRLLDGEEV